ncbi:helix-turn-helix domain-containing protein [Carnobacterium maltaromaticum]
MNQLPEFSMSDFIVTKEIYRQPTTKASQMYIQFIFVTLGQGSMQVNDQEYLLKKGSLLWLFSYHVYHLQEVEEELHFITFQLSLNLILFSTFTTQTTEKHLRFFEYWDTPALTSHGEDFLYLNQVFSHALTEYQQQQNFYELSLVSDLYQVIVWFERSVRQQREAEKELRKTSSDILLYLSLHFSEELTLTKIANQFKTTPQTINRRLKLLTGKTFTENLASIRMNNAVALLKFDELTIAYVANYVGYSSIPSFNKQFKALIGCSPSKLKQRAFTHESNSFRFQNTMSYEIYTYITTNYMKDISVKSAAKYFYASPTSINQILLNEFSMTFNSLLEFTRMLFARSLLLCSTKKIEAISEACGYLSIRTFNRSFLAFWGNSPKKYKESLTK